VSRAAPRFTSRRVRAMPESVFARMDAAKAAARAAGHEVVDLSIGASDLPPPPQALAAIAAAVADPTTYGYCLTSGTRPLREAAVRWFVARYGEPADGALDPDAHALPLIGAQEGFAHLLLAVADAGDAVLLPDPAYPSYFGAVAAADLEPIALPLTAERGYRPDLDAVAPADARRAKALVLNYPNNPTAGVADDAFFDRAIAFCRDHDLLLIHDFPYVDTVDGEACAPSVLARPGGLAVAVELYSASKSFHMGGFRVGFALGQPDAIQALADAGWSVPRPEAGMYVWAPLPGAVADDATSFCEDLVRATGVALAPGPAFGRLGAGHVRFALMRDAEVLRAAAARVGAYLQSRGAL